MDKKNSAKAKVPAAKSKRNPVLFALSVLLLAVIAVAFVFSPGLISQNSSSSNLGSYDGIPIKYDQDFARMVEYYNDQYEALGYEGDFTIFAVAQAFNYAVLRTALVNVVEIAGYTPPTSRVNREMLQYFVDENGVYSEKVYQEQSDAVKIQIRNVTEESVKTSLYVTDVSGIKISSNERDFVRAMNNAQRSFNLVSFSTEDYPQEEIINFGTENAELFTTYSMDVITVDTEEVANTVASRIANNELTFADAITEYSNNQYSNETGNLINTVHYRLKDMVTNVEDFNALVALQSGNISDVIKTTSGYSIFSVTANATPISFSNTAILDETISTVYNYVTIYEAGLIEDYFINRAKDFSTSAVINGYNEAVEAFGLTNVAVDSFPVNYDNVPMLTTIPTSSAPELAQAQSNEQFFEVAFSLSEGELSDPIVLGSNVLVLSLVEEVTIEDVASQAFNSTYSFYAQQFDTSDITSFFVGSDKVENNSMSLL